MSKEVISRLCVVQERDYDKELFDGRVERIPVCRGRESGRAGGLPGVPS